MLSRNERSLGITSEPFSAEAGVLGSAEVSADDVLSAAFEDALCDASDEASELSRTKPPVEGAVESESYLKSPQDESISAASTADISRVFIKADLSDEIVCI